MTEVNTLETCVNGEDNSCLASLSVATIVAVTEADPPVLILSIYPEEECEVRTLKDGASGYLTKERAR